MNRLITLLLLMLFLIAGCKKSNNNPHWEKTYGKGKAMCVAATSDSGLVSCGEIENFPYFNKLDKNKNKTGEYKYTEAGVYYSVWSNGSISVATGAVNGKMLISCFDNQYGLLWDTTFSASFSVVYSTLCSLGNGNMIAMASGKLDSVYTVITGIYTVWFNTGGVVTSKTEIKESSYMSANKIVTDNSGNIFVAFTRKNAGSESKATVAKYDNLFRKIWETELYNNPSFGASSKGIVLDNTGNIYVTGKTQLPVSGGQFDNSFTVSLSSGGLINWKEYLEDSNTGIALKTDNSGHILTLNQNCFVIYSLNSGTGTTDGIVRVFDACESKNTTNYGWSLDIGYDDYLIMAGQNGGRYYLCEKPPVSYSQTNI